MNIIIRPYQDSDLSDLMASWESASSLAHPFLTAEFQAQVRKDIPALYLPNADTWVAEIDSNVVGFISLLGNEVGALFVATDHHKQGVGKTLMDKALSLHTKLELEVFKENSIGREFYKRYGFEQLEEQNHELTGNAVLKLAYAA